jgi:hypothetical protein
VPPETTLGRDVLLLGAVEELPVLPVLPDSPVFPESPVELPWDVEEDDPPAVVFEPEVPDPFDVEPSERLAAPGCSCATSTPRPAVTPTAASTLALVRPRRRDRAWSLVAGGLGWL